MMATRQVVVEIVVSAEGLEYIVSQTEELLRRLGDVRSAKWGEHARAIQLVDDGLCELRDWLRNRLRASTNTPGEV